MLTTFRFYQPDQLLLLSPDLREWLPPGHLAHDASDLVDALELGPGEWHPAGHGIAQDEHQPVDCGVQDARLVDLGRRTGGLRDPGRHGTGRVSDYTASSGTLSFAPGETAKTVTVAVLDDSYDEGSETLTLVLSYPFGAYLADGEATGTIENSDLMPQAWLSRFGRTVAEQVLDALEEA